MRAEKKMFEKYLDVERVLRTDPVRGSELVGDVIGYVGGEGSDFEYSGSKFQGDVIAYLYMAEYVLDGDRVEELYHLLGCDSCVVGL